MKKVFKFINIFIISLILSFTIYERVYAVACSELDADTECAARSDCQPMVRINSGPSQGKAVDFTWVAGTKEEVYQKIKDAQNPFSYNKQYATATIVETKCIDAEELYSGSDSPLTGSSTSGSSTSSSSNQTSNTTGSTDTIDLIDIDNYSCEGSRYFPIFEAIKFAIVIIQIAVPFALIVWGSLDWFKALIAHDEKEMRVKRRPFITRLVIAILVLILPWLLSMISEIVSGQTEAINFWTCYSEAKPRIDFSKWKKESNSGNTGTTDIIEGFTGSVTSVPNDSSSSTKSGSGSSTKSYSNTDFSVEYSTSDTTKGNSRTFNSAVNKSVAEMLNDITHSRDTSSTSKEEYSNSNNTENTSKEEYSNSSGSKKIESDNPSDYGIDTGR